MATAAPSVSKRKYQVIFPQYIDSYATPATGRKVNAAHCVPAPSVEEIFNTVRKLGFEAFVDPLKSLPCAQCGDVYPAPRGCVRVAIKAPLTEHYIKKSDFDTQTRANLVEDLLTKGQVLRKVAEIIAAIPGRKVPPAPSTAGKGAKALAVKTQKKKK